MFLHALQVIPPLLVAIILHEVSHGYVAEKLGDPTARRLGRITLNPIVHIDLMMTIIVPAVLILSGSPIVFGGAKPVPVNPNVFKKPRVGMAIVAAAGPITNFLLAVLFYLLFIVIEPIPPGQTPAPFLVHLIQSWVFISIPINVVLGLFNLLPIPPLDGGRIAVGFLPLPLARFWARLEPYGLLILVFILWSGWVDTLLHPALRLLEHVLTR